MTLEDTRDRIDYPLNPARATRVVALDERSAHVVAAASSLAWHHARFYRASDPGDELVRLSETQSGPIAGLGEELEGVDSLVLVAASAENAEAIETIGAACRVRGVMTAGLMLAPAGTRTHEALTALRPHARILLVPAEDDDLVELLTAIRA